MRSITANTSSTTLNFITTTLGQPPIYGDSAPAELLTRGRWIADVKDNAKLYKVDSVSTFEHANDCLPSPVLDIDRFKPPKIEQHEKSMGAMPFQDTTNIAIIQFDSSWNWPFPKNYQAADLTQMELILIDSLYNSFVRDYNRKLSREFANDFGIKVDKSQFRRQYIATLNPFGEKEVWINCFCAENDNNWRKEIVVFKDGGNCFFDFKVNLKKRLCYGFSINGYAKLDFCSISYA